MIEILAASIIGLLALTTFMFVRKLRKPKPADEIKLQKIHVMRLGPFSGQSNSFKGKSVVFMMLLSSLSYAEVDIVTLDNFFIDDLSEMFNCTADMAGASVTGLMKGPKVISAATAAIIKPDTGTQRAQKVSFGSNVSSMNLCNFLLVLCISLDLRKPSSRLLAKSKVS